MFHSAVVRAPVYGKCHDQCSRESALELTDTTGLAAVLVVKHLAIVAGQTVAHMPEKVLGMNFSVSDQSCFALET